MNDEEKKLMKEAMKEFMESQKNETYQGIGRWVANGFAVLMVIGMIYFVLWVNGFHNDKQGIQDIINIKSNSER